MQNIFRDLEISRQIIELIRTAHSKIILASPTIEFWQQLNEEIALVINNQINVVVITQAHPDTNSNALDRLLDIGVTIRIVQNLTTSIYYNENIAILTSMNLKNPFNANFKEVAIQISDHDSASEIYKYLNDLVVSSENYENQQAGDSDIPGFCIRCGDFITFSKNSPFCDDCHLKWSEDQNEEEKEQYCHKCGETFIQEWEVFSYSSPLCNVCS